MGPGQVGVLGQVHVNLIAKSPEAELAAIRILCLVVMTVLGRKRKSLQIFVMEGPAVQVWPNLKVFTVLLMIFLSDISDFIGCFKKQGGLIMDDHNGQVTPCYCIGYCNSLNYIFAATYDDSCYCGNITGHKVNDSLCTKGSSSARACRGDSSQVCGGYHNNEILQSVYGTGR